MTAEHGDDHREAPRVDARRDPPRHRELRLRDQRLHLQEQRPAAFEDASDGGADLSRMRGAEELGRVGNADKSRAGHLEDPELVGRPEAVLGRAQDAMRVIAIALELEHAVDEVLEHTRAGDGSVLRHMPDQDRRDARLLRDSHEADSGLPHLRDRSRRGRDLGGMQRLDRVHDAHVRGVALERLAHGLELGLGEDADGLGAADARSAERHLRGGLLPRHEHGAPARS